MSLNYVSPDTISGHPLSGSGTNAQVPEVKNDNFGSLGPPHLSHPGPSHQFISSSQDEHSQVECRSVYVGGTGNITISASDGTKANFENVQAGTVLPTRAVTWSGSADYVVFLY